MLFSLEANAADMPTNVLNTLMERYLSSGTGWTDGLIAHATRIFLALSTMSLVFTFGFMAMRQADLGELFSELARYIVFTGFFLWLLTNAPIFIDQIFKSLDQMGSEVTGQPFAIATPTTIVEFGFSLFEEVLEQSDTLDWPESHKIIGYFMSLFITIILALIGIHIVLVNVAVWVLAFGGVFLLGFGSSRWTSDIAIGYYKSVLGVAISWLTMVILLNVGVTFLNDIKAQMENVIALTEMSVMLIAALALLVLMNKIPAMLSSIVTGARVGGAMNVTGMVSATVISSGAAMSAGIASAASNTQQIMTMIGASREEAARRDMNTKYGHAASTFGMSGHPTMYSDSGNIFGPAQDNNKSGGLASAMGSIYTSSPMSGIAGTAISTAGLSITPSIGKNVTDGSAAAVSKSESSSRDAGPAVAGNMQSSGNPMINVAQPSTQAPMPASLQPTQQVGITEKNAAVAGNTQSSRNPMVNVAQPSTQAPMPASLQPTQQVGTEEAGSIQLSGNDMVNPVSLSTQASTPSLSSQTAPQASTAVVNNVAAIANSTIPNSLQSSSGITHYAGDKTDHTTTAGSSTTSVMSSEKGGSQTSSLSSLQTAQQGGSAAGSTQPSRGDVPTANASSMTSNNQSSQSSSGGGSVSNKVPTLPNPNNGKDSNKKNSVTATNAVAPPPSVMGITGAGISANKEKTKTIIEKHKLVKPRKKMNLIDKLLMENREQPASKDDDEVAAFSKGKEV